MHDDWGYLDHLHEQLDRVEDYADALHGVLGWDIDVWLAKVLRAGYDALGRPGLTREPARLAQVSRVLMTDLPEALRRVHDTAEPDAVVRRLRLAAELARAEQALRHDETALPGGRAVSSAAPGSGAEGLRPCWCGRRPAPAGRRHRCRRPAA